MPPNGKRQQLSPPDVLSNILESVMDDILMRLPLRDAVRTSILSKKWRHNWCRLPQLRLDEALWKTKRDLTDLTSNFTKIIYHILTLHAGPITKFTLSIPHLDGCPNIDNFFYFLSRNDTQHLVLELPTGGNRYKLPSSFFTCLHLRHLTLNNTLFHPPPVFKGFERLISLELSNVTISSELLGSLISHCLLLEHLVLKDSHDSNPIEISAPKLRSFVLSGKIHLIHLKHVPLLSNVSYEPTEFSLETEHDLAKIFESIPAVENLRWEFSNQDANPGPIEVIPTRLPYALNCLKRLYLSRIFLQEFFEFSFALCLIRSSPNLEEIEIEACASSDEDFCEPVPRDAIDEIPASFSDMTFNHLRTVTIYDVAGGRAEMQLIKVLLAKSPALIRMVIKPCGMEDKKSFKILAEITKFQRASSKAEVVYNVD
ncbi:F-box/FBD/LRR-repeat protein At1g13570-like [Lycium barbarum]|uniref:F-box/FBD/LRR-repeat protein At1g13570-like n=1 Tax=Lycium barbarum TaxID=112863 RepID=UPI00293EE286|nr:F-box/FBD/LRR-repeat protein At1g13570-like [Lycium barbarum]XP_060214161.1 F-box/FBD/LRR-repeat protein At1g13570-like [Lycium barbarum]